MHFIKVTSLKSSNANIVYDKSLSKFFFYITRAFIKPSSIRNTRQNLLFLYGVLILFGII